MNAPSLSLTTIGIVSHDHYRHSKSWALICWWGFSLSNRSVVNVLKLVCNSSWTDIWWCIGWIGLSNIEVGAFLAIVSNPKTVAQGFMYGLHKGLCMVCSNDSVIWSHTLETCGFCTHVTHEDKRIFVKFYRFLWASFNYVCSLIHINMVTTSLFGLSTISGMIILVKKQVIVHVDIWQSDSYIS